MEFRRICLMCHVTENGQNLEISTTKLLEISVGYAGPFIPNPWILFPHSSFFPILPSSFFEFHCKNLWPPALFLLRCTPAAFNLMQNPGKSYYFSFYYFFELIIV